MRPTCSFATALAIFAAGLLASAEAWAGPLDEPHVGGVGFAGPTTGHVAAAYWNPAALGLIKGNQIEVGGQALFDRTVIDATTGRATSSSWMQPLSLPPAHGFVGAATDFGSDRLALGIAAFTPFHDKASYDTGAAGSTRYQAAAFDVRHLALAPALAARIWRQLRIGFSPWALLSTGSVTVAQDTAAADPTSDCGGAPCGLGHPAAAAVYHLRSGFSPFDGTVTFVLNTGAFMRLGALDLALTYIGPAFGGDTGSGVNIRAARSSVERPARQGGGDLPCPATQPTGCVTAEMAYRLPDIWIAGVAYRISERLRLAGTMRYLNSSAHQRVDVRLFGSSLDAAGLPTHLVLGRGFQDSVDLRVGAEIRVVPMLLVAAGVRVETPAVPRRAVSPAAVDGFTYEPMLAVELVPHHRLSLRAGYAVSVMPNVGVSDSAFDPSATATCRAAALDLDDPACRKVRDGFASAPTLGTYSQVRQTANLVAVVHF